MENKTLNEKPMFTEKERKFLDGIFWLLQGGPEECAEACQRAKLAKDMRKEVRDRVNYMFSVI